MTHTHIGHIIRQHRIDQKLTQIQVARAAQIRVATLCDIELGKQQPSFLVAQKIITVLNGTIEIKFDQNS